MANTTYPLPGGGTITLPNDFVFGVTGNSPAYKYSIIHKDSFPGEILQCQATGNWAGLQPSQTSLPFRLIATLNGITSGNSIGFIGPFAQPLLIARAIVYITTVSTGAATIDVGTAAGPPVDSGNLLTALDVHSPTAPYVADNLSNPGTSGKALQYLAANSYVSVNSASDTTGLIGYLFVMGFSLDPSIITAY